MLVIICDGSSKGNPGPSSIGVVVWKREALTASARRVKPTHTIRKSIGEGTNNVAEWMAVIEGVKYASELKYEGEVFLYTDSLLVASQAVGNWKIKNIKLKELCLQYLSIVADLKGKVVISWIPRQLTVLADKEANGV